MAQSKLPPDHLKDEIRMVLVGKTGTGKSATGNTILGIDKFESCPSSESVTEYCEYESTFRFGKNLQVVDTPGFMDTQLSKEEKFKRIAQCVILLSPGIHAILFVLQIGRFTEEDVKTVEAFIELFGPESRRHVIPVFTRADDLTESYDLQKFITKSKGLKPYLKECNNRYIAVNNNASSDEKEAFTEKLLCEIELMQKENGENFYTSEMFRKAEEQIRKVEAEIEKRNRANHEKNKKEALTQYKAKLDELKIDDEKQIALIEEKEEYLTREFAEKNAYEARKQARHMMTSFMLTSFIFVAGTVAGIEAGGYVGGTVGAALGPVGAIVGFIVGSVAGTVIAKSTTDLTSR